MTGVQFPSPQPPSLSLEEQEEGLSSRTFVVHYQERLLHQLYIIMALFGIPFLVYLATQWLGSPVLWAYVGAIFYLLLLIWSRAFPGFPYSVRVWMGLILLYGLSGLTGVVFDNPVQSILWLLSASFLGAIFLPTYQSLFNMVLALITGSTLLYITTFDVFPPGLPLKEQEPWGLSLTAFVIVVVASQMVFTVYRRRLETSLEESHQLTEILERERERLEKQGKLLEKRVHQIRTVAEISQAISNILAPDRLLWEFVDRVHESFGLYYTGVFLLDPGREFAQLAAGSGEAGRRMVEEGYRLPLGGGSMIAWAVAHRQPRVAQDVKEDPTHFPNPYLPLTRSEGAFPLMARGEVLGAMTVQFEEPYAFDEETIQVIQMLADRLAIALSNARLFQQLQRTLQQLESLQRQLAVEAWSGALPQETLEVRLGTEVSDEEGARLRVPLLLHGVVVGEVEVEREQPWTEEERTLLQSALQHYLSAFQTALLFQQSRSFARMEEIRRGFVEQLGGHMELEPLMEEALRYLARIFQAEEARLYFTTTSGNGQTPSTDGSEA